MHSTSRRRPCIALLVVGGLAASCTRVAPAPVTVPTRAGVAGVGAAYELDPGESTLRIYAYRGGTLASLGHNHVLVARGVHGRLGVPDDGRLANGRFAFAVDALSVDEPEERRNAGADFPGTIDAGDIAGTRTNLLGPAVLDAGRWPEVEIEFSGASGTAPDYLVAATLIVRGVASQASVPVHVMRAPGTLTADGDVQLSQAALGLVPFSVLLGALKVEDRLHVRFHLVAHPAG